MDRDGGVFESLSHGDDFRNFAQFLTLKIVDTMKIMLHLQKKKSLTKRVKTKMYSYKKKIYVFFLHSRKPIYFIIS